LTLLKESFKKLQNLTETEKKLYLLLSKAAYSIEEISTILTIRQSYAYFLICQLSKKIKISKISDLSDSRRTHYFIDL